jgi:hypothetical protein
MVTFAPSLPCAGIPAPHVVLLNVTELPAAPPLRLKSKQGDGAVEASVLYRETTTVRDVSMASPAVIVPKFTFAAG